jgi:IgGFc binding protein
MHARTLASRTATASTLFTFVALAGACGSATKTGFADPGSSSSSSSGSTSSGDLGGSGGLGGTATGGDPATCAEAAAARSYVGCDYWPTITPNTGIDPTFDFAVVVANIGSVDASVTVTGASTNTTVSVKAGALTKIYLPWNEELKGPTASETQFATSTLVRKGAFHVVSDRPVVVYQFNPLEFEAKGGPPDKDWSDCKISFVTMATICYSYSNDASLLIPSTAMTGTYRIMGSAGFSRYGQGLAGPVLSVTGTQDGTNVSVKLSPTGTVLAGAGIHAAAGGGTLSFTVNAGDIAQVTGPASGDFSGSLLTADKPVQVITSVPCIDMPAGAQACDHIEENVFPAETLGKHYVVNKPTTPRADVGHIVRFFGNADATTLTYLPSVPRGCPTTLNAGQVVECGPVTIDFEVTGSHEFGVGMFMLGGTLVDPGADQPLGDPSQTFAVTVEQYRRRYVFLAPADYTYNYVDIVGPPDATVTLDGKDISSFLRTIPGTSWAIARVPLSSSGDGAHTLEASKPIGIQVLGYGENTTYHYPGGLNLGTIAPLPPK